MFIIDCIYPPKRVNRRAFDETTYKHPEDYIAQLIPDDIEDEISSSDAEKYSNTDTEELPENENEDKPEKEEEKDEKKNKDKRGIQFVCLLVFVVASVCLFTKNCCSTFTSSITNRF